MHEIRGSRLSSDLTPRARPMESTKCKGGSAAGSRRGSGVAVRILQVQVLHKCLPISDATQDVTHRPSQHNHATGYCRGHCPVGAGGTPHAPGRLLTCRRPMISASDWKPNPAFHRSATAASIFALYSVSSSRTRFHVFRRFSATAIANCHMHTHIDHRHPPVRQPLERSRELGRGGRRWDKELS